MEPGTIVSIIDASAKGLKILWKLKEAFRGDATSKRRLEGLESRLEVINYALQKSADIEDFQTNHQRTLAELQRTVSDCNKLLKEYEHALSDASHAKANLQRAKFALVDDTRLTDLHSLLTHHLGDLTALHTIGINTSIRKRESVIDIPNTNLLAAKPKPIPQKSDTLITCATGTTIYVPDEEYHPGFGRRQTIRSSPELGFNQDSLLSTSPASSNQDPLDSTPIRHSQKPIAANNPWARELNEQSAAAHGQGFLVTSHSVDLLSTASTVSTSPSSVEPPFTFASLSTPPSGARDVRFSHPWSPAHVYPSAGGDTSYAASNASTSTSPEVVHPSNVSVASNSAPPPGEVTIKTRRQELTFVGDRYKVALADDVRVVEWFGEHLGEPCHVKHYVPLDNRGIPFTRPTDKKDPKMSNQLVFMSKVPHRVEIKFLHNGAETVLEDTLNHYIFTSRKQRQAFQEEIRGAYKMVSFRALTISTNCHKKSIARDVKVKIWMFEGGRSTLSFARNLDTQEHEELQLNCFQDYKDIQKPSYTVTLRVPPKQRKHSLRLSMRSRSDNGEPSASRRSSMNSVISVDDADPLIPLPEKWAALETLKLEFQDKDGIRADFCRCWTEAYHRSSQSLPVGDRSPTGSRPSGSPLMQAQMGSRPGSFSSSPVLLSSHFPHPPSSGMARTPSWGQHSPVHAEWLTLGQSIQEESSQDDDFLQSVIGPSGYRSSNG